MNASQPPPIDLQTLFTLAAGLPNPNAENPQRDNSLKAKGNRRIPQLLDALAALAVCDAKGQVVAVGATITQELVTLHVAENRPVPENVIDHLKVVVHRIKEIRSLVPRIPGSLPYAQDSVLHKGLDDLEERMIEYAWPKLRQRFCKRYDDFYKLLRDVVYEDGNAHAEADRNNAPDARTLAHGQLLLKDLRNSDTRKKLTKFAEALGLMSVLRNVVSPTSEVALAVRVAMLLLKNLFDERVVDERGQDMLDLCTLYLDRKDSTDMSYNDCLV